MVVHRKFFLSQKEKFSTVFVRGNFRSSNIQAPSSREAPNFKSKTPAFEAWSLEFLWMLELGIWSCLRHRRRIGGNIFHGVGHGVRRRGGFRRQAKLGPQHGAGDVRQATLRIKQLPD